MSERRTPTYLRYRRGTWPTSWWVRVYRDLGASRPQLRHQRARGIHLVQCVAGRYVVVAAWGEAAGEAKVEVTMGVTLALGPETRG